MIHSRAIVLTQQYVSELYNFGNVTNLLDGMMETVIGFGSRSVVYAQGKKPVARMLCREYTALAPCQIARVRFRERTTSDGSTTVVARLVLNRMPDAVQLLYRVSFMYVRTLNGLRVSGIHIVRDAQHESTYRIIGANALAHSLEQQPKLQAQLQAQHDVMESYVDCAYVIYQLDGQHTLSFCSDEFWTMLGYASLAELTAKAEGSLLALVAEEDRGKLQQSLTQQLERKAVYQVEYRLKRQDGTLLWVMECGRTVTEKGKMVCNSMVTDITPLKKTRESLIYREAFDRLTGLYNKNTFYQRVQEILRLYPKQDFEIMRMDIERFKVINELFGEESGNQLLQYIARFFHHLDVPNIVCGRIHSDHFVVCYPVEDHADTRRRLIASLEAMAASFSLDYKVVLRFGVYRVKNRHLTVAVMCDRAGLALHKAKQNGLMVCGEYSEQMRQYIVDEQAIVNEMNEALEKRQFILYLQPKYDLTTDTAIGAEALVRWQHPTRGFISPAAFIPVFEHNGFIFQLDCYVWEEACRLLRRWIDEGRQPRPLSVNVSRVDLYSGNLVQVLESLVKKYDLPPQLLELELTESAYVDNPQQIIEVTKQLQERGFVILMDDFGSGYSSLNMLKDLPVDILKIDLKFLDDKGKSGRGGNVLNSVVRMAKWLHLPIIVEGVETRQQVEFLRTIGCNCVQGYYYSRPLPIAEYEKLTDQAEYHPEQQQQWLDGADFEELLNPNTQFNLLFNSIHGGIGLYELTSEGFELLRANDGYFVMFGYDRATFDMNAFHVVECIHEADREKFLQVVRKAGDLLRVCECRLRRCTTDGRWLYLKVRVSPIVRESNDQLFYMILEDVTELEQKTRLIQDLFDHVPAGVGIYTLRGNDATMTLLSRPILELNEMTGAEAVDYAGGSLRKLLGDATMEKFRTAALQAAQDGQTVEIVYDFTTPVSGEKKRLQALINATAVGDGSYHCYALLKDVTASG